MTESEEFVISKVEAQRSATLVQVLALLGAILCIVGAAALQPAINNQRKELQLTLQSNIYKELPPEYAWVSAAGGTFRGVAADILWTRAESLKEEGKYYELHNLAKWICTLQPRFAAVWAFQAWNMSFNISVATHTPQERWQWVYNGIRLIRDEGIPNNERVVPLYHWMAWTWFFKVGDRLDDFHMTYKRMLAATMERLLGPPPAAVSNAEAINWFRPVAEAPLRLDDLIAAKPGVAALVAQLKKLGLDPEEGTNSRLMYHPLEEKFFQKYATFYQRRQTAAILKHPEEIREQDRPMWDFFASAPKPEFEALLAYLRAKVLREQYKMDPQYMLAMTGRLGTAQPLPIDWRTPWAQCLYWSMYGTDKGRELKSVKEFDLLAADRDQLFALKTLAKVGRYVFRLDTDDPMGSFLNMTPDLRYIEAMHQKYVELGSKHKDADDQFGPAGETLRGGHVNELEDAIVDLFLAGHVDQARKYLEYLAVNYKSMDTHETQEQYTRPVELFVQAKLREKINTLLGAHNVIYALLASSYNALAAGYVDEYSAAINNARMIYDQYQKDKLSDAEGRRLLPPFAQMRADALVGLMLNESFPIVYRASIWSREQEEIRQRAYDFVILSLTQQCDAQGVDVKKAFPEPAGMAQYRKDHPKPEQVLQKKKEEPKP